MITKEQHPYLVKRWWLSCQAAVGLTISLHAAGRCVSWTAFCCNVALRLAAFSLLHLIFLQESVQSNCEAANQRRSLFVENMCTTGMKLRSPTSSSPGRLLPNAALARYGQCSDVKISDEVCLISRRSGSAGEAGEERFEH